MHTTVFGIWWLAGQVDRILRAPSETQDRGGQKRRTVVPHFTVSFENNDHAIVPISLSTTVKITSSYLSIASGFDRASCWFH